MYLIDGRRRRWWWFVGGIIGFEGLNTDGWYCAG